jgi:hypothetical protein
MAAVTCLYPTTGTLTTPGAVTSPITISGNDIQAGGMLLVLTGVTPSDITLADPGTTPAGTAAGTVAPVTVAANTGRTWGSNVLKNYINPSTNLVSITLSSVATVTVLFIADGD